MTERTPRAARSPESGRKPRHGSLTAAERIDALLDAGTFHEWGAHVEPAAQLFGDQPSGGRGDGVIAGFGQVDGHNVFAFAQDFSVLEGTLGERGAEKIVHLLDRAADAAAPVVGLLHSNGARLSEGIASLEACTQVFQRYIAYSGRVPIIAVAMGFCSGFPAYLASLSDLVIMVERTSFLVTTSPAVIRSATGQRVGLAELGGARTHAELSGVAHLTAPTEAEALLLTRDLLAYLTPGPVLADVPTEAIPALPFGPHEAYDVKPLIRAIVDGSRMLELWPRWARNVVCAFVRLGGRSVGVVANQPLVDAGAVTVDSARKMSRFVRLCDRFGLPLLFLVDVPGILPGIESEHGGILFEGAQFYRSLLTEVPRLTLVTRKCYGGAYGLLNSKQGLGAMVLAYPDAKIGVMGAEVASQILGDGNGKTEELAKAWKVHGESARAAAQRGIVDRLVEPADTREELLAAFSLFPPASPASRLRRSGWL
ncbi:MAG: methylmalonyl-CoA carboxyltransferase [Candidatus Sericytochromatia bacterium]|uniref:Methylmalonyl-CoA carboxyltransferase n=1 Tax=Candidatus Tanganyikabacteria bacterium TaxID=2961651 RepID=A0A938BN80_9BACT|nr:methylmalonyl-CoA carboxyltransferase [Candidatus Tanganyikabacteria bacterium]